MIEIRGHPAAPMIDNSGLAVGDLVASAHRLPIDEAVDLAAAAGLERAAFEAMLIYCAEQRCAADHATCPGCRRRTMADGIGSLDDYVARHGTITTADGRARLNGAGTDALVVPSLEDLARTWAGEEIWFQARRMLRKLRYGTRSKTADAASETSLRAPAIVLVEPQLADNIGMVGRAMANFGLSELRLVNPRDGWPNEKARIAASGATFIIDDAGTFADFPASIADCQFVVATTARQRDLAKPVMTPEQAITEIRRRTALGERCAIVFGRERNGLETGEVAIADAIVMAPVDKTFASLNLAQSVLLLAYEWMKQLGTGSLGRVTTYETPITPGEGLRGFEPATKAELLGFFEHLEGELDAMGFFTTAAKRPTMVQNLRTMFTRLGPSPQEVRTLRGIVKALVRGKGAARRQS